LGKNKKVFQDSLIDKEIEEAWRIIGEISEIFIKLLTIHKPHTMITIDQTAQFLHYFDNLIFMGSGLKRTLNLPE